MYSIVLIPLVYANLSWDIVLRRITLLEEEQSQKHVQYVKTLLMLIV